MAAQQEGGTCLALQVLTNSVVARNIFCVLLDQSISVTIYGLCWRASKASELSHVRVQSRFQIRTCIYIYIYMAVRQPICACSVVRNVGGVKCGPLSKP